MISQYGASNTNFHDSYTTSALYHVKWVYRIMNGIHIAWRNYDARLPIYYTQVPFKVMRLNLSDEILSSQAIEMYDLL